MRYGLLGDNMLWISYCDLLIHLMLFTAHVKCHKDILSILSTM